MLADMNPEEIHGHFTLFKDGTISFRTSTDVRGGTLSNRMVQNEIDFHFTIMQKHVPELHKYAIVDQTNPTDKPEPQPMPDDETKPVPQDSVLVGKWKTVFRDAFGNLQPLSGRRTPQGRDLYPHRRRRKRRNPFDRRDVDISGRDPHVDHNLPAGHSRENYCH